MRYSNSYRVVKSFCLTLYLNITNCFAADFREMYMNSIQLALSVGLPENEVLKCEEEIDAFFWNEEIFLQKEKRIKYSLEK